MTIKFYYKMGCGNIGAVSGKQQVIQVKDDVFGNIPYQSINAQAITPIPYGTLREGIARGCNFEINQRQIQLTLKEAQNNLQRQQMINKINKIQNIYQRVIHYYSEHNIDECAKLITTFKKIYDQIQFQHISPNQFNSKQTIINKIQQINNQYAQMIIFEKELSRGGWLFKSESNGISISSRHEENTVGVLVQSVIDVPVQIFLSVISEMELYSEFVPFISASKQEKMIGRNHKIGYCIANFPFLSKRQAFFQGVGYNRLNHDSSIFMYSRSLHNRLDICQKLSYTPILNKQFVQIQFKYLIVRYQPIDKQNGKVSLAMNIDMQLNFLPMFILDKACQTFGQRFFLNIMDVSKNFKNSLWQERIKVHHQTFKFFKSIIEQYFSKKRE